MGNYQSWLLVRRLGALFVVAFLALPIGIQAKPVGQLGFGAQMASRGLWSEALFRFRQAEKSDPDNPRILNNIAVSLEALGLYDEALEQYRKAVEVAPNLDHAKKNYARFVDFYQAFKGGEVELSDDENAGALAEADPEAAQTAASAQESGEPTDGQQDAEGKPGNLSLDGDLS